MGPWVATSKEQTGGPLLLLNQLCVCCSGQGDACAYLVFQVVNYKLQGPLLFQFATTAILNADLEVKLFVVAQDKGDVAVDSMDGKQSQCLSSTI